MSQYNFIKSGRSLLVEDNTEDDTDFKDSVAAIVINYMTNALRSACIYSKHSKRNAVLKEDIKRAFMTEVFLMRKRTDTVENCLEIKQQIRECIEDEESSEEDEESEYDEPEDEFCESECKCGLCVFMNKIHSKWETFEPSNKMEEFLIKVLHTHIENM